MAITEDTQQRLLDAAGQIFAEKGFASATVREICRRADANIAAVNYYFGDKERLYIEAVQRAAQGRFEQVPIPHWEPGTPVVTKLRDFIRTFVSRVVADQAPRWHLQLIMRELFQPTAACVEFVRNFARPQFELLLGILAEILPPETPAVKRHLLVFSIVGQCLHYRLARPVITLLVGEEEFRTYDADLLAEHIAAFSLAALGLTRPQGRHAGPQPDPGPPRVGPDKGVTS
jgi:AcrR family transcriptional regulator